MLPSPPAIQASPEVCCGRDADVAEAEPSEGLGGALPIACKAQSSIMPPEGRSTPLARVDPLASQMRAAAG